MMNEIITGNCSDGIANFLFLDFNIAPNLLYYSYIPILVVSLFLGLFIFFKNKESIFNRLFFLITFFFSLWIINVFIQWIAIPNYYIYISWVLIPIFEIPIYLVSVYFIDVFCHKKDISTLKKTVLSVIYILFLLFSFTGLNISGYDYNNCEGIPGILLYFIYAVEFISLIWIALTGLRYVKDGSHLKRDKDNVKLLTLGLVIFLGIFLFSEIFGEVTSNFEINLIGPLGMVVFLGITTYCIVQYQTFRVKLFATQALVWGLVFLIGSQFFFIKVPTNFILNGITFVLSIIFGYTLIKSVKKEIEQKEHLQVLKDKLLESNSNLGRANEKLKSLDKLKSEFVSLASHQLRSPLTAIKGYTSMLIEGDYGEMNPKVKEIIDRIMESSNNLTLVVEDLLNVTKIEQGGMKYDMSKIDFAELINETAKDLSITCEKKGLKLICNIPTDQKYFINGDKEKLRQVLINLIDNAIKYTKEGQIEVNLQINNDKIVLFVKDTGAGISETVKGVLFQKFSRGDGAKLNSDGSGLGLYLVKEIVEAHKGHVWVESEGLGKGSTFFVEIEREK